MTRRITKNIYLLCLIVYYNPTNISQLPPTLANLVGFFLLYRPEMTNTWPGCVTLQSQSTMSDRKPNIYSY